MKKKNMPRLVLLFITLLTALPALHAEERVSVSSPDGQLNVNITLNDRIHYDVVSHGTTLLSDCRLSLTTRKATLGEKPALKSKKRRSVKETLTPTFPLKYAKVENAYNELTLTMKGGYAIEWRVFNDGLAYRFVTTLTGEQDILDEEFALNFPADYTLTLQQPKEFKTSCEENYSTVQSNAWNTDDKMSEVPFVISTPSAKILVSEAELFHYPGMFVKSTGKNGVRSLFAPKPLRWSDDGDRRVKIEEAADCIATVEGKRAYPWRYMVVATDDAMLVESTMGLRLAGESRVADTSWIKPGQVSWEWWNGATVYGPDVNFKSGFNLDTYKYFIDFAAHYGIPYILLDEGWAASTRDPFTPNPTVDLHELIRYGKEKGVGIWVWLTWLTVDKHMDLFKTFAEWGVKGVKIDFMDRQDQWMVDYYERVAQEAAANHIMVDFHGAYHPSGMELRYPNVLSFEGVRGMEFNGSCKPENSVYYPFIRNVVGPMDYTPGAMVSMQPDLYAGKRPNNASIGTRAYQLALYVLFESHLTMLADSPTRYYQNDDCTRFITSVPVNWDETRVLYAKYGETCIVAKRKGSKWYVGGMTAEKGCDTTLPLSFLTAGRSYKMTSYTDGPNAFHQAMDYRRSESTVTASDVLDVHMVRNGGFAAVIEE